MMSGCPTVSVVCLGSSRSQPVAEILKVVDVLRGCWTIKDWAVVRPRCIVLPGYYEHFRTLGNMADGAECTYVWAGELVASVVVATR